MTVRCLPWPAGDPWASIAALHATRPPIWFDDDLDAWIVIGHRDASEVLRGRGWSSDPARSAAFGAAAESMGMDPSAFGRLLLFSDPPTHTRVRRSIQPPFGPGPVEGLRRRIRSIAEAALDTTDLDGGDDSFDLMASVARAVPLAVIGELFGLPAEVVGLLADESPALVRMLEVDAPVEDLAAAVGAFTGLLLELLPLADARRSRPDTDVFGWIANDTSLSLEEVVFAVLLLVVAGHETTANLVGTTVARADLPRVVDRPWTVEAARRFGPVQAVARVATEPQRIGEVTVAPGEQVVVALGAANRDPVVFPDPDAFVLGRTVEPLTFGLGRHHCLGARLALLELEEIVGAIVARGTVETGPVVWNRSRTLCGPDSVPIRIVPHPT